MNATGKEAHYTAASTGGRDPGRWGLNSLTIIDLNLDAERILGWKGGSFGTEFLQFAGAELVRELLPVLDDFERAMKTECSDAGYRKGIELIYQRLLETFKRMGLEPIEVPAGTEFDPNLHQAVVRGESGEVADNTVIDVLQRGYNFKGKLLRPAMVRVAVDPAS